MYKGYHARCCGTYSIYQSTPVTLFTRHTDISPIFAPAVLDAAHCLTMQYPHWLQWWALGGRHMLHVLQYLDQAVVPPSGLLLLLLVLVLLALLPSRRFIHVPRASRMYR